MYKKNKMKPRDLKKFVHTVPAKRRFNEVASKVDNELTPKSLRYVLLGGAGRSKPSSIYYSIPVSHSREFLVDKINTPCLLQFVRCINESANVLSVVLQSIELSLKLAPNILPMINPAIIDFHACVEALNPELRGIISRQVERVYSSAATPDQHVHTSESPLQNVIAPRGVAVMGGADVDQLLTVTLVAYVIMVCYFIWDRYKLAQEEAERQAKQAQEEAELQAKIEKKKKYLEEAFARESPLKAVNDVLNITTTSLLNRKPTLLNIDSRRILYIVHFPEKEYSIVIKASMKFDQFHKYYKQEARAYAALNDKIKNREETDASKVVRFYGDGEVPVTKAKNGYIFPVVIQTSTGPVKFELNIPLYNYRIHDRFEVYSTFKCYYLAVEYSSNYVTLEKYICANKYNIKNALQRIFSVLGYFNKTYGFVHGDFKHDNVLVSKSYDPKVKLFDFDASSVIPEHYNNLHLNSYFEPDFREKIHESDLLNFLFMFDCMRMIMSLLNQLDFFRRNRLDIEHFLYDIEMDNGSISFTVQDLMHATKASAGSSTEDIKDILINEHKNNFEFVKSVFDFLKHGGKHIPEPFDASRYLYQDGLVEMSSSKYGVVQELHEEVNVVDSEGAPMDPNDATPLPLSLNAGVVVNNGNERIWGIAQALNLDKLLIRKFAVSSRPSVHQAWGRFSICRETHEIQAAVTDVEQQKCCPVHIQHEEDRKFLATKEILIDSEVDVLLLTENLNIKNQYPCIFYVSNMAEYVVVEESAPKVDRLFASLVYKSNSHDKKTKIYLSNSGGPLVWRVCYLNAGVFEKGNDYVKTTYLNPWIQVLINLYVHARKRVDSYECGSFPKFGTYESERLFIHSHKNPVLSFLSRSFRHVRSFATSSVFRWNIYNFMSKLEYLARKRTLTRREAEKKRLMNRFKHILLEEGLIRDGASACDQLCHDPKRSSDGDTRCATLNSFCEHDCSSKETHMEIDAYRISEFLCYPQEGHSETIQRFYKSVAKLFFEEFSAPSNNKQVFGPQEYAFTFGSMKIEYCLCKFDMCSKYDSAWYTVWYMKWRNLDDASDRVNSSSFKRILMYIEPVHSHIGENGLNDEYVSAGIVVNKMFEYKEQLKKNRYMDSDTYDLQGHLFDITTVVEGDSFVLK